MSFPSKIFQMNNLSLIGSIEKWPEWVAELLTQYFRLEVDGFENLPKDEPFIIVPNHSGYLGLDAVILSYTLKKRLGMSPFLMTHRFWFNSRITKKLFTHYGFVEATHSNADKALTDGKFVVIFPEGEKGNFKPSISMYELQEFKRGFIRMALRNQVPIIPTAILGAEESTITLSQIRLPKALKNLLLPIPINLLPLPVKWKIVFRSPTYFPYPASAVHDNELVNELASDTKQKMQLFINKELRKKTLF